MGKKRAMSPKRIGETLIANTNRFTADFDTNKEIVNEMMKLPKTMRNRVAGYITQLKRSNK